MTSVGFCHTKRPGPPYPANDCKNARRVGNDGLDYQSVPDKNGRYTWKRFEYPEPDAALIATHDKLETEMDDLFDMIRECLEHNMISSEEADRVEDVLNNITQNMTAGPFRTHLKKAKALMTKILSAKKFD